ncbi:MAG TPA: TonB C-terminal domain-containing protein [Kofleriaceae bacterium]
MTRAPAAHTSLAHSVLVLALCGCGAGQQPASPRLPPPATASAPTPPSPTQTAEPASTSAAPSDEAIPAGHTALKTRAHPFALYIARLHRQLHPQWGERVLGDFDQRQNTAVSDPNLAVQLALAIDATGNLAKLDVVVSSKLAEFDEAAVKAFRASGPYPTPPDAIKSKDGLVHFRWTLYRDDRQCGTFSVEPIVD